MSAVPPLLRVEGISFRYGAAEVLREVSFDVSRGEVVAVVGSNGAGKSTLLRILARAIDPSGGSFELDGRPVSAWDEKAFARAVGYLQQEVDTEFRMSALDVALTGRAPYLTRFGWESRSDVELARRALVRTDASHLAERDITEMSGGEKKRVFLARVLAGEPRLVLLDEPFSSVDVSHVQQLGSVLREIAATGTAIVFVSHDLNWSMAIADRVIALAAGEVIFDGPSPGLADAALVRRAFGIDVDVVTHGGNDWIVPRRM